MKQMIAFFDIDGTLTSEIDGSIPESVNDVFKKATENGHLLFLCSGRCIYHIEERFKALNPEGIVCGCGTHIVTNRYGEILHHRMNPSETALIRDSARNNRVDLLYESSGKIGFDPKCSIKTKREKRLAEILLKDFGTVFTDPDETGFCCDKVCAFSDNRNDLDIFAGETSDILTRIDRGDGLYEMVPRSFSKASGIEIVLKKYNIPLTDSWAFGDSNNDLSMLKYVGHPVVMGNAKPETLKEIAEYVAPRASENGIAVALEELGFLDS